MDITSIAIVTTLCTATGASVLILLLLLLLISPLLLLLRSQTLHIASLQHKHVVITGGSSGIGFALAQECLSRGASVTLIARNASRLSAAAEQLSSSLSESPHNRILLKAVDVSDAKAVMAAIQESFQWKPIDIVMCNAGVTMPGFLDTVSVNHLDLVTKTNLLGCVYTLHAVLPLMKARSRQHPCAIVLMSSASALLFVFGGSVYTCAKYGLRGLAETLRFELLPYNIKVSLACPGFTDTPMLDHQDACAEPLIKRLMSEVHFYDRAHCESVDDVAAKTIRGVMRGEFLITTNMMGFLLSVLSRGNIPAESPAQVLLETLLLVPLRLSSFIFLPHVKKVIKSIYEKESLILPKNFSESNHIAISSPQDSHHKISKMS